MFKNKSKSKNKSLNKREDQAELTWWKIVIHKERGALHSIRLRSQVSTI